MLDKATIVGFAIVLVLFGATMGYSVAARMATNDSAEYRRKVHQKLENIGIVTDSMELVDDAERDLRLVVNNY